MLRKKFADQYGPNSQSIFSQNTQTQMLSTRKFQSDARSQSRITEYFPSQTQSVAQADVDEQRFVPVDETNCDKPMTITEPNGRDIQLRPVTELPLKFRSIFNFPYFNIVQSKIIDKALYTDEPVVLCAPTGSGKTVLFEMALIRLLTKTSKSLVGLKDTKAIYMAPIKALCSEKYEDWKRKFASHGVVCKELTGDSEVDDFYSLRDATLIFTTPEKWDSMTRRWKDNKSFIKQVKLFMIDEVHLLNDKTRGSTVEAVVSRMKLVNNQLYGVDRNCRIRMVAVSATMANVEDVAEWLGPIGQPAAHYQMDDDYRPVQLHKVVIGYPSNPQSSDFKFDYSLNYKIPQIIREHSNSRPTLVFVSTRKGTQQTASMIKENVKLSLSDKSYLMLKTAAQNIKDTSLKECVVKGVGYHNAGLVYPDRKAVEELFLAGDLLVLVSTSTLAMGVNLPAHLVIIKSTQHYTRSGFEEYTETEILQMIGRAGRPQFDTAATAVIMTKKQNEAKYRALVSGTQFIESSLHKNLLEHLNAEIVLQTIPRVEVAIEWIKATFLYVRIMKNPSYYGLKGKQTRVSIEAFLQKLCVKQLDLLYGIGIVSMDSSSYQQDITPTESGRLMARYCVSFDTMNNIYHLTGTESQEDLITFLANCKEFNDIQLRISEKKTLNDLNKNKDTVSIRYPMKGKIKNTAMKISCLIQGELGCLPITEFSLSQEVTKIFRTAARISKCLVELYLTSDNGSGLYNATILHKCISAHLWENSSFITKQLPGIGRKNATAFINAGIQSFTKLADLHPREIELICNRHPPFGNTVSDGVKCLPKYEMALDQETGRLLTQKAEICVALRLANREELAERPTAKSHCVLLLISDADNRTVVKVRIYDNTLVKVGVWCKTIHISRATKGDELNVYLLSLTWVGLDICSKFTPRYSGPMYSSYRQVLQSQKPVRATPGTRGINPGVSSTINQPQLKRPGPQIETCAHKCHNKRACGHACCKPKPPQRTRAQANSTTRQPDSTKNSDSRNFLMPIPSQLARESQNRNTSTASANRKSIATVSSKLSQFVRQTPVQCPNYRDSLHVQSGDHQAASEAHQQTSRVRRAGHPDLTMGDFDIISGTSFSEGDEMQQQVQEYQESSSPPLSLQGYTQYDWQDPAGLRSQRDVTAHHSGFIEDSNPPSSPDETDFISDFTNEENEVEWCEDMRKEKQENVNPVSPCNSQSQAYQPPSEATTTKTQHMRRQPLPINKAASTNQELKQSYPIRVIGDSTAIEFDSEWEEEAPPTAGHTESKVINRSALSDSRRKSLESVPVDKASSLQAQCLAPDLIKPLNSCRLLAVSNSEEEHKNLHSSIQNSPYNKTPKSVKIASTPSECLGSASTSYLSSNNSSISYSPLISIPVSQATCKPEPFGLSTSNPEPPTLERAPSLISGSGECNSQASRNETTSSHVLKEDALKDEISSNTHVSNMVSAHFIPTHSATQTNTIIQCPTATSLKNSINTSGDNSLAKASLNSTVKYHPGPSQPCSTVTGLQFTGSMSIQALPIDCSSSSCDITSAKPYYSSATTSHTSVCYHPLQKQDMELSERKKQESRSQHSKPIQSHPQHVGAPKGAFDYGTQLPSPILPKRPRIERDIHDIQCRPASRSIKQDLSTDDNSSVPSNLAAETTVENAFSKNQLPCFSWAKGRQISSETKIKSEEYPREFRSSRMLMREMLSDSVNSAPMSLSTTADSLRSMSPNRPVQKNQIQHNVPTQIHDTGNQAPKDTDIKKQELQVTSRPDPQHSKFSTSSNTVSNTSYLLDTINPHQRSSNQHSVLQDAVKSPQREHRSFQNSEECESTIHTATHYQQCDSACNSLRKSITQQDTTDGRKLADNSYKYHDPPSQKGSFVMDSLGNSYNTSAEHPVRKFPSLTDAMVIESISPSERRANLNADLREKNIITAKPSAFAAKLKPTPQPALQLQSPSLDSMMAKTKPIMMVKPSREIHKASHPFMPGKLETARNTTSSQILEKQDESVFGGLNTIFMLRKRHSC